ncbi:hypothetical protein EV137_5376 [Kribbella pratensis]|jgi:hypothetical protein|uniref:PH domain-containing protein n=1 Tax=Kribbella pratensis TaxID=2512112 RepID=A0ABY2F9M5_9ACTN|nr:hypothetical protein [Kribbella pratensis]TDW87303.1 hypothetical protein EV137_5376 [Kribbella pratensis]TDW91387.1 hypothetical protein EV647_4966 [Kribbella sp. VKM Ac-2566]
MGFLRVSAETWTSELESNGSVNFRPRRSRLAVRLVGFGLLMVLSAWTNVEHLRTDGISGALGVLRLTALAAFVYGTGWTAWQLITNRPVITVDAEGVTRGRSLQWSGITSIDEPAGWPLARAVQINPADRRTRPISIPQDHVGDLDALAPWLRSLHEQHRD